MIYFVYALEDPECLIKIGYTGDDVEKRIAALQIGSPLRLRLLLVIEGTFTDETSIHAAFTRERRHNEWFYPSPRLCHFIRRHLGESFERTLADAIENEDQLRLYAELLGWRESTIREGIKDLIAS